jgi:ribonuclease-3
MDFKSALQENLQATGRQASYVLVKEVGPEHSKTFTVEVRLSSPGQTKVEFVGRAEGTTKKKAEQDAARQVLEYLAAFPGATEDKSVPKPSTPPSQ